MSLQPGEPEVAGVHLVGGKDVGERPAGGHGRGVRSCDRTTLLPDSYQQVR